MAKTFTGMVHPCGSGAFGYFETTADVSDLTKVYWITTEILYNNLTPPGQFLEW